jgi:hypothetical protein
LAKPAKLCRRRITLGQWRCDALIGGACVDCWLPIPSLAEFFAIGQPLGSKAYPAPPGPTAAVPLATTPIKQGIVHFGKREGTKAVLTQKDITAASLPDNAGFGIRIAVSHDGGASLLPRACAPCGAPPPPFLVLRCADTMVTAAPAATPTGSVFVYKNCRSDSGCELASTIIIDAPGALRDSARLSSLLRQLF